MLESPDELARIPETLRSAIPGTGTARRLIQAISPEALAEIFRPPVEARSVSHTKEGL
jgi:hypothetical protein